ncbi:TetR/AcrR family transcriptional regulator [Ruegeria arenilitoris]|uniref:TetR/AcrR family transcriptional regulator n=1 Tax=Ruegeria arenilitoris TaxID=1173585 RepID=UPI00147CAC1E|nr:TetR/AcrR family transcriptional regulator [Ruegeria arenilitoris]
MERNSSDVKNSDRPRRKPAGAAVLQDTVTEAIQRALFEEWAETGYSALRMERIAARAGVGKAALYRRSKSKFELVTEAVKSAATNITPIPDTGSFEEDVAKLMRRMAATLRHPLVRRILPDLHAEHARSDELAELLESVTRDRRAQAMVMLDRAIARGELPKDTDRQMILDMFIAPLYWHVIVQHRPVRSADIQRFTNLVLSV